MFLSGCASRNWPRCKRPMLRLLFTVVLLVCHMQSALVSRGAAQEVGCEHGPARSTIVDEGAPWGHSDFSHRLRERDWTGSQSAGEKQRCELEYELLPALPPCVEGTAQFVVARTRLKVGHLQLCDRAKHERSGVALI